MAQVQGTCDPYFESLRALFQHHLDAGLDTGASIHVIIKGKSVVDLYGGCAHAGKPDPWTSKTIVNVFSTTKTIASLALLLLVDRGLVDVNKPVCTYWPEFAQNGKENVLVRHVLSHTSGICGWSEKITIDELCNVKIATDMLENQPTWFEPGKNLGYQMWTMGFLIGEIVRRVTGLSLKEFVEKEIAVPLGADFQIGAKEADWDRVATMEPPPPGPIPPPQANEVGSIPFKAFTNPVLDAAFANTSTWRNAEIGAGNGHGTAKGIATILSHFITQGVDSEQLDTKLPVPLSQETINLIFQPQMTSTDVVVAFKLCMGIGFGISGDVGLSTDGIVPPGNKICFWGGWGGSWASMDLDRRVTVVYVMNKMNNVGLGGPTAVGFLKALYKVLGVDY